MSEKNEKSGWAGKAAIAGAAAVGSAAIAAAMLYASRRKEKPTAPPARPQDAPETD
jgi:hypothetical protein